MQLGMSAKVKQVPQGSELSRSERIALGSGPKPKETKPGFDPNVALSTFSSTATFSGPTPERTRSEQMALKRRKEKGLISPAEAAENPATTAATITVNVLSQPELIQEVVALTIGGWTAKTIALNLAKRGVESKAAQGAIAFAGRVLGTSATNVAIGEAKAPDDEEFPNRRRAIDAVTGIAMEAIPAAGFVGVGAAAATKTGKAIGRAAKKIPGVKSVIAPFRGRLNPDAEEVFNALSESGGTPTIGQLIKHKTIDFFENVSAAGIFSGGYIQDVRLSAEENSTRRLIKWSEGLANRAAVPGNEGSKRLAGTVLEAGATGSRELKSELTNQLYSHVDDLVGKNSGLSVIPSQGLKDASSKKFGRILLKGQESELRLLLDDVQNLPDFVTFQEFATIRSRLRQAGDVVGKALRNEVQGAGTVLSKEADRIMSSAAKKAGGGVHEAWREANALSHLSNEQFGNAFMKRFLRTTEAGPEALYKMFISKESPSRVKMLREIVNPKLDIRRLPLPDNATGKYAVIESSAGTTTVLKRFDTRGEARAFTTAAKAHGEDYWKRLQGEFMLERFHSATKAGTREIDGNALMQSLKSFSDDSMKELFPVDGGRSVVKFARGIQMSQAAASEGSDKAGGMLIQMAQGTALVQVGLMGLNVAGIATGVVPGDVGVVSSAVILMGPRAIAWGMQSEGFKKWASVGMSHPPGSKMAARAFAKIALLLDQNGFDSEVHIPPTEEERQKGDGLEEFGFDSSQMGSLGEEQ